MVSRVGHYSRLGLVSVAASLVFASLVTSVLSGGRLLACPFCSAVPQTLRQEMGAMDTIAIARIVAGSETDSDAEFEILSVLKGEGLIREKQVVRVTYFGKAKPDQRFLLMGVGPPDLLWSVPRPVTKEAIEYISAVNQLPESSLKRHTFYMKYLENRDSMLAQDAYDEFASAPYSELKQLKPQMDRQRLLKWIKDTSLPPDRKRLYLVMLGVCGEKGDADILESMLQSKDPNRRAGLDAMIACYVTLKGADGLKLIDELFLANTKSQYADTYAAIMALRFHGTDAGVLDKERILKSMRLILDRPQLADLVIPDLARWEDWTQVEKLVELFKTADKESSWVRVPVINYLRACPLPEAAKQLDILRELDPATFKRATSFFPVPRASASETDSSSILPVERPLSTLATDDTPSRVAAGTQLAMAESQGAVLPPPVVAVASPNRSFVVSVLCMVSVTLWITMWLAISGAGSHGLVGLVVYRTDVSSH